MPNFIIDNIWTQLDGFMPSELKDEISDKISYVIPDADFAIRAMQAKARTELEKKHGAAAKYMATPKSWDGRQRFFFKKTQKFPTGLISHVGDVLHEAGMECVMVDRRVMPPETLNLHVNGLQPHDFQSEILREAILRQRGIIRLATGGGKTEIMAMLVAALNRKALILIHRETIFRQLVERLSGRLGIKVGAVGGGLYQPADVTVAMLQTVTQPRFIPFLQQFPVVIVDECHHVPSETAYAVLNNCTNSFFRYGFTATPWRDDNADMFIEAAFARFICNIGPSDLIERGFLTKPKIMFIETDRVPQWDLLSWQGQYAKCVVDNKFRNRLIVDIAAEFHRRRKTVLIAVTQIGHGKHLLKLIRAIHPQVRAKFIQGIDESDEKQRTLKQLDNREVDVVIATSVFGEGVDVRSLDAIINAKAQDSQVDTLQLLGRVLRTSPGKTCSYFIDFMDRQFYTKAHSQKRFKLFNAEPQFDVSSFKTLPELVAALDVPLQATSVF